MMPSIGFGFVLRHPRDVVLPTVLVTAMCLSFEHSLRFRCVPVCRTIGRFLEWFTRGGVLAGGIFLQASVVNHVVSSL